MQELFIDIGNSQAKFALLEDDEYQCFPSLPTGSALNKEAWLAAVLDWKIHPEHVYVSSVGSAAVMMMLRDIISQAWQVIPVELSTQEFCCELENGYEEPHALGVDRWMAMAGARALTERSFIVIDAGTAITVDVVFKDKHRGGFIVPGLSTMRKSLQSDTAQLSEQCDTLLDLEESDTDSYSLATNTQSAICGGTLYMAAAYLNQLVNDLEIQFQSQLQVFVTGGDGALLQRLLNTKSCFESDLVLQGMMNVKESIKKS